jgi:hypothetical protein
MAITSPSYAQSGVATSQFTAPILFNDLNSNDRSYIKDLVYKYGNENYALVMQALGQFMDTDYTDNHTFYHYEKRQLHQSFAVLADVTAGAAGAAITVTVGAGDYYESGNRSPIRAGETMMLASSNILVQIVSVNTASANAHTATIKPLDSTVVIASAGTAGAKVSANDLFLFRGATNVGEGSTRLNGLSPIWDKISNTVTEHRDDFNISDIASMEKQEIKVAPNGQPYMYDIAVDEVNRRWMNDQFWKLMEGVTVTNTGLNANVGAGATNGTKGVIPYVNAGGSTVQYTAGAPTISDWQALARQLKYYGGASEYHMLQDYLSKQAMDNFLFTTFKQTYDLVSWKSVGGSKEAAVAYGFDTFRMNDITWHLFFNPQFSATSVYKRPTPLGAAYDNYSLAIPQRQNIGRDGGSYPAFQIVYQKQKSGDRIMTFETGGLAAQNKTTTMERNLTQIGYYGSRVFGANGFANFQGI